MPTIIVDIPEDFVANFDNPGAIRKALFEDFVIGQRQRGVISPGRAAELLAHLCQRQTDFREKQGYFPVS